MNARGWVGRTPFLRAAGTWVLLTLLLLPATYVLWLPGLQTTMDGLYHKSRFFELDWLLRLGGLYPRWLPHQGFLYGFPTLHYYAPLIYYIAEFFHLLGWGFLAAYEWMIGLGLVAAGWTMFYYARRWGVWTGGLAAIAYTYWVYHFSLAYVRGAQAELWGMVWFPLLLALIHRAFLDDAPFPAAVHMGLALVYAALILTHNLSAFLFTPVALGYLGWLLLARRERWARALGVLGSMAWGALMSAFYWLPVLLDIRYVRAGHTSERGIDAFVAALSSLRGLLSPYWIHRYQPFQGTESPEPLGRVALLLALGALLLFLLRGHRWSEERRRHFLFFTGLALVAIFGLCRWSAWFWRHIPLLYYIQFPWRLESLIGLGLAMMVGLAWGAFLEEGRARGPLVGGSVLVGMTLLLGWSHLAGLHYDIAKDPATWKPLREEDVDLGLIVRYDYLVGLPEREYGGIWAFEYMPVWSQDAVKDFFLPPPSPPPEAPPWQVRLTPGRQHPYDRRFRVVSPHPWTFSYHQFYFPAWRVEVDGAPVPTFPRGRLGLVAASVPAGEHEVRLRYTGTTAQRRAEGLALIGMLLWLGWAFRRERRWLWVPAFLLLFFLGATVPARLHHGQSIHHRPRQVLFDHRIRLVGSRVVTPRARPGGRVWFTLDWLALTSPARRYKVMVHLVDARGRTVANGDTEPGFFFTPTTRWQQGEVMEDWYTLSLPADLPPGSYALITGLYDAETVRPLPFEGEEAVAGGIRVGTIVVEGGGAP